MKATLMTLKTKKLIASCLLGVMAGSIFAISGNFTAPISGSNLIDGNIELEFHPGSLYNNWGFRADAGEVISDDGAYTITINILEPSGSGATNGWGMYATNGGKINLESAVIVNGLEHGMTGLIVYDDISEMSVGNNSRIVSETALTSYGKLTVGDNAYLWGNTWGGNAATVEVRNLSGSGGAASISIGNGATIISDASVDSAQEHHAISASGGGTVIIGDDAFISLEGLEGLRSAGSSTVHVGSATFESIGTVRIGDRATITAGGDESAAIEAFNLGSQVIIGDYAKISTTDQSDAVLGRVGSVITIGKNAEITTVGESANGVSVTLQPGSGTGRNDASISLGEGARIKTEGASSDAVRAFGFDGYSAEIKLGKDAIISTLGNSSYGVTAYNGGTITVDTGAEIKTEGNNAFGVASYLNSSASGRADTKVVIRDGASISTSGQSSVGVYVRAYAAAFAVEAELGNNITITTSGSGANGLHSQDGASITAGDGLDVTASSTGYGLYSYANLASDTSITVGDNARIASGGAYAVYARSNAGSRADITLGQGATINANGSYGIMAYGLGSKVVAGNGLAINGNDYGVYAYNGGQVELEGAKIVTNNSYALVASGSGAKITANGNLDMKGHVYAANGSIALDGKLTLEGNIEGSDTGVVNIVSSAGSYFKGATAGTNVNLDMTGTEWEMTNYSLLSNISVKANSVIHQTIKGTDATLITGIYGDSFSIEDSTIKVTLDGYEAVLGDVFHLVFADEISVTGSFNLDLSDAVLAEGLAWDTSNFMDGGYIEVIGEIVIPEPAELAALFGALALGFAAWRRRK